ncbi:cold-shock protein [Streptomyces sp. NPDC086796]|uniref:cold-shock protein n=1 Tax=unclassified Streptomyces TaxID=2593676 RepID=UPI00372310D4
MGLTMVAGRVVRFDGVRGYAFISPDHGGEVAFPHANDLLMPESLVRTGVAVGFDVQGGDDLCDVLSCAMH